MRDFVIVLAGAVIGWSGQALTLSGRVDSIELQVREIHQDLRTLIQGKNHDQETPMPAAQQQGPFPSP